MSWSPSWHFPRRHPKIDLSFRFGKEWIEHGRLRARLGIAGGALAAYRNDERDRAESTFGPPEEKK